MKKYLVTLERTDFVLIPVEAENEDEATEAATKKAQAGEYVEAEQVTTPNGWEVCQIDEDDE